VKTLFSEQDRTTTVKNFISARYQGRVKVQSWIGVQSYLNGNRVKLLLKIEPTEPFKHDIYGAPIAYRLSEYQAMRYFEWLIHIVSGAIEAQEDIVKEAINQLFIFIHVLRDSLAIDNQVTLMAPYNWEDKLVSFENQIADLKATMEKRDEKFTYIITRMYDWMKKFGPILDELEKDYGRRLGKALKKDD
jgi:hypothetical protein